MGADSHGTIPLNFQAYKKGIEHVFPTQGQQEANEVSTGCSKISPWLVISTKISHCIFLIFLTFSFLFYTIYYLL